MRAWGAPRTQDFLHAFSERFAAGGHGGACSRSGVVKYLDECALEQVSVTWQMVGLTSGLGCEAPARVDRVAVACAGRVHVSAHAS